MSRSVGVTGGFLICAPVRAVLAVLLSGLAFRPASFLVLATLQNPNLARTSGEASARSTLGIALGTCPARCRINVESPFRAPSFVLWRRSVAVSLWITGAQLQHENKARASVPRSRPGISLKSAPDLPYDLPPADERKRKTTAESNRHLGNPIVTHRFTLIRHPAGTKAPPRQKNVVGKGTDLDIDTPQSGLLRVTRTPRQLLVNHLRRCFRSRIGESDVEPAARLAMPAA